MTTRSASDDALQSLLPAEGWWHTYQGSNPMIDDFLVDHTYDILNAQDLIGVPAVVEVLREYLRRHSEVLLIREVTLGWRHRSTDRPDLIGINLEIEGADGSRRTVTSLSRRERQSSYGFDVEEEVWPWPSWLIVPPEVGSTTT